MQSPYSRAEDSPNRPVSISLNKIPRLKQSNPRISVALAVHNGGHFLADAIDSHLAQTFDDFELVVYDNASSDSTQEIARDYAGRDPRVLYHRREQLVSGAKNFNLALDRCETPFFKWSAHDDMLAPDFLARCIASLEREPDAVLCHCEIRRVDEHGAKVRDMPRALVDVDAQSPVTRFHAALFRRHGCLPLYGVMRTEAIRRTRLFGPYLGSDRILLAEIALEGRIIILPEPLFMCRDHQGRTTHRYRGRERSEWFDLEGPNKLSWPRWRRLGEYERSIARASLSPGERRQCRRALIAWAWRERGGLSRNLASGIARLVGLRALVER